MKRFNYFKLMLKGNFWTEILNWNSTESIYISMLRSGDVLEQKPWGSHGPIRLESRGSELTFAGIWPEDPPYFKCWLYPRIIVTKSYENTSKYVDTVTLFFQKKLNQRSLTPGWPLTPNLLRSHVWLYPRIIVSKSHENTSKYVDTEILFIKNLKGHWPLDDLWPHIC